VRIIQKWDLLSSFSIIIDDYFTFGPYYPGQIPEEKFNSYCGGSAKDLNIPVFLTFPHSKENKKIKFVLDIHDLGSFGGVYDVKILFSSDYTSASSATLCPGDGFCRKIPDLTDTCPLSFYWNDETQSCQSCPPPLVLTVNPPQKAFVTNVSRATHLTEINVFITQRIVSSTTLLLRNVRDVNKIRSLTRMEVVFLSVMREVILSLERRLVTSSAIQHVLKVNFLLMMAIFVPPNVLSHLSKMIQKRPPFVSTLSKGKKFFSHVEWPMWWWMLDCSKKKVYGFHFCEKCENGLLSYGDDCVQDCPQFYKKN